ncbi:rhomboid family intramembrane serine protease [Ilumatobacter sp.]|uniref:rhomboid family intramembrane serine protease n=1 Tax=Ilumatobacter sp. TaxID=1967498 RepID=UPI003B521B5D
MPLPPPPPETPESGRRTSLPPPDRRLRQRLDDGAEACFRHANRAAGRRCTRCGRPACAECLEQASVGSHCVECAEATRPDVVTRARYWQASKPAIVATSLIALNVAIFAWMVLASGGEALAGGGTRAHADLALFDSWRTGILETARGPVRVSDGGDWYRLVTSGFVHYGIIHLAFNMYFLWVLGNQMEPQLGRGRFAALYAASLLGGSAGVVVIDSGGFSAGASGAIFGLLGAFAVGVWQHGVNPFSTQIGTLLLINLGITFFIGGISIGGHVGGLVAGSICGFVMMAPGYKGYPRWSTWALPAVVGLAAVVVAFLAAG